MFPWPSTSVRAVSRARSEALPPLRRMGICPAARKNQAIFQESKYSALARKVTLRVTTSGMKNESQKDWWLAARTAGPDFGMFSRPSTLILHRRKNPGLRIPLSPQYATEPNVVPPHPAAPWQHSGDPPDGAVATHQRTPWRHDPSPCDELRG